ncbi:MAG TPA: TerC family protein [Polyangiales bacterium]|nr:TerC family protein [Polyangiales bacterium]
MEATTIGSPALWSGFIAFVFVMLALDLGVFNRKPHVVGMLEATLWSLTWITLSLAFNAGLAWRFGTDRGLDFLSGYLIEKSLSIDNIFVFVVIFAAMRIPASDQHRVLFWGVLSALALRAAMIFAGTALLSRFHALFYVFGGFLIATGIRMFLQRNKDEHFEDSRAMQLARKYVRSSSNLDNHHFFTIEDGRRLATPLFMALVFIELSDIIFAVDSIPAVLAVTDDPFIVFTSNICAILGLRSMFFLLANVMEKFRYLKLGLMAVLIFVGTKMTLVDVIELPSYVSLAVIALIIGIAAIASWIAARQPDATSASQS